MALDYLDQLDLACYALTRTDAFSSRKIPDDSDLEAWLPTVNPAWRQGPGSAKRLQGLCEAHTSPSYGLSGLLKAAPSFLSWTGQGWQFKGGTTARKLLRLRLPLGTVHAAAAAQERHQSVGDPPTAVVTDDVRYRLRQLGAVDNHVHVGTCLPFDGMFELLQQHLRLAPPRQFQLEHGETSSTFKDSDGVPFQSSHPIAMASLLGGLLDAFLASGGDKDFGAFVDQRVENPRFAAALAKGNTWSFLQEGDPSRPGNPSRLSGTELLAVRPSAVDQSHTEDPYRRATQRKLDLLRKVVEGNASEAYIHCVEDLLRCEALIHFALLQGNRAGLREFLSVSNRLSRLRHSLPEQSRTVIQHGLPYLANAMRLSGVELRTAEQFDGHKSAADLARSLDAKLAGYEDAIARLDPDVEPPRATWPICLIKTSEIVTDSDESEPAGLYNLRFELRPMFDLVNHTADLLIRIPAVRKLIPGFDVAGDECAAPNWCFALLFSIFDERLRNAEEPIPHGSAVRVHAGEDYFTPLQGLRRIYEALTWLTPQNSYARIGHALALSSDATQSPDRALNDQPLDEAFDDLVWAWGLLKNQRDHKDLRITLEEAVKNSGEVIYGMAGISPSVYLEAYEQRFSLEALQRLGVVTRSVHRQGLELMRDVEEPAAGNAADQLLYDYLTRRELGKPCGSSPLLDELLLREVTDVIRPLIRQAVCSNESAIEACPTSNLIIGGIDDYRRHPMHKWSEDADLKFTINTDDPGLFSVTLADEYAHYWESSSDSVTRRDDALERMVTMSTRLMQSLASSADATAAVQEARAQFRSAGMISRA